MQRVLNLVLTICFLGITNLLFGQPPALLEQAASVEELVVILGEGKVEAAMEYFVTNDANKNEIKVSLEKALVAIEENGKAEDYFLAISPNYGGKANHTNFECTFFSKKGSKKESYYKMNLIFDTKKSKDKIAIVTYIDKKGIDTKDLNYLENEAKQIDN